MGYKVFIDGKEGTTGLRIDDYLQNRDDIEIIYIDEEQRKDIDARLAMMEQADITFLCLPDIASKEIVSLAPQSARILDTSTAHRVNMDWVYGLPELSPDQREKIKSADRVAVPGCHATGFILLVKPLIEAELAGTDYPFTCHSITGYSGGGKQMIADYEHAGRSGELDSPRQYGLAQKHKHLPEMTAMTGIKYEPAFNPIVSDFYSGMLVTVPITSRMLKKKCSLSEMSAIFREQYKDQPLVKVMEALPTDHFIGSNNLAGHNIMEIYLYGNDDNMILAARYDNLGKGASGGAVQCMNLMLGEREEKGLI